MKAKKRVSTLILTYHWFDEILSGRKTEEYREFKPFWIDRFCVVDEKGEIIGLQVKDIELSGEFDMNGKIIPDESVFTIYLGKIIEKINI